MKQSFVNKAQVRGYVFSHTLQERVSNSERNNGAKYISGIVNVATDDDALNVVPVNFFTMEKTKSGSTSATFETLKQIIDTGATYEALGTDAMRVRIDGSIDVNDFYNRDGELVSGKRVRGSFIHFLNANEEISTPKTPACYIEADALLQAAIEREGNDGEPYVSLQGFVFNYRGDALPVSFSCSSESGMNFFLNEDISASNPYFGTIWGDIRSTVVVSEKEVDDSQTAFGQRAVQETTRTFRTWEIVGANMNSGMDETTITQEELQKAVAEREVRLAELKQRSNTSAATGFSAPAKTVSPASTDYVF